MNDISDHFSELWPYTAAGQIAYSTSSTGLMAVGYALPRVGASVYSSAANQSIPNNTYTTLSFNAENYDTNSFHDNTTNNSRLTIPITGDYIFYLWYSFMGNTTGVRQARILLDGGASLIIKSSNAITTAGFIDYDFIECFYPLNAGSYVEAQVFQNSGGNLDTMASINHFRVHLIGIH
jgi:hypothetical protein